MKDGFVSVACATPRMRLGDCRYNAEQTFSIMRAAEKAGVQILVLPELGLTGATCGDLFLQEALLRGAQEALLTVLEATRNLEVVTAVGLPLRIRGALYNCAAVIQRGRVVALIPKAYLTAHAGIDEGRYFTPAPRRGSHTVGGPGHGVTGGHFPVSLLRPDFPGDCPALRVLAFHPPIPFGAAQILRCDTFPEMSIGFEIGSDLEAPSAPSGHMAVHGAVIIGNLAAPEAFVTRNSFRRQAVSAHSARLVCAYLYAGAGDEESVADAVFSGHQLIVENGRPLAERCYDTGLLRTEIDTGRLTAQRLRSPGFVRGTDSAPMFAGPPRPAPFSAGASPVSTPPVHDAPSRTPYDTSAAYDTAVRTAYDASRPIPAPGVFTLSARTVRLTRYVSPSPFVPEDPAELSHRCQEILFLSARALKRRLETTHSRCAVLGLSGGLDSTLAALVCVRALDMMDRPASDAVAVTMPGLGTTSRTRDSAEILAQCLGMTLRTVPISGAVLSHFRDIGHDPGVRDTAYENAQARERTQILMDIANAENGLVIGTGDLSELALGWCTYNGDHMSMYAVNASIPKTLIRHMVRHAANECRGSAPELADTLSRILDTPVSPELLPAVQGQIAQKTEDLVGPYELHDFFLYYTLRYGFTPGKIYRLATAAFGQRYTGEAILKWSGVFFRRFFTQQFKRDCVPDGPQIGSVGLGPRGAWHMPSDASAALWQAELDALSADL